MKRSPIIRRTPLSRARLRSGGPAAPGYEAARVLVFARCGGRCELCGRTLGVVTAMHAHHRRPRSAGRDDRVSNLLGLCGRCHGDVHGARRGDAEQAGWVISRYDQRPARMVPVLLADGWHLLGEDTSRTALPGMSALSTVTRNTYQPGDGNRT